MDSKLYASLTIPPAVLILALLAAIIWGSDQSASLLCLVGIILLEIALIVTVNELKVYKDGQDEKAAFLAKKQKFLDEMKEAGFR